MAMVAAKDVRRRRPSASGTPQTGATMKAESMVTAPLRARARPSMVVPVFRVMEARAMMVPSNAELVPRVAELPTCQKMLQGSAPLMRRMVLSGAVTRVEPAWKIQKASGLPAASSVRVPENSRELLPL